MTANPLVLELENTTAELLTASESGLAVSERGRVSENGSESERGIERVERLLTRRAAVLQNLARTAPEAFTPSELASLRASARMGQLALENLTLFRRRTALEGLRLNRLRLQNADDNSTFSLSA